MQMPPMTPKPEKEKSSGWNRDSAPRPHWGYRKVATYLNAVIVCCFVLGPIVYFLYTLFKPDSLERFVCSIAGVVLGIISLVCLSSAVEQYMLAKDQERDEILEALDRIRRGIEEDCEEE